MGAMGGLGLARRCTQSCASCMVQYKTGAYRGSRAGVYPDPHILVIEACLQVRNTVARRCRDRLLVSTVVLVSDQASSSLESQPVHRRTASSQPMLANSVSI